MVLFCVFWRKTKSVSERVQELKSDKSFCSDDLVGGGKILKRSLIFLGCFLVFFLVGVEQVW